MRKRIFALLLSAAMAAMAAMPAYAAEGNAALVEGAGEGLVQVNENKADAIIPNGKVVFGQPVKINTSNSTASSNVRWFTMELPRSGRITVAFRTIHVPYYGAARLTFFDANEKSLFYSEVNAGKDTIFTADLDAGMYYIKSTCERWEYEIEYTIAYDDSKETVTDSITDPHNNALNAAPYKAGSSGMNAFIAENGLKDVFKYEATNKMLAKLDIKTTDLKNYYYKVYDKSLNSVSSQSGLGIGNKSYEFLLEKGTYYIEFGSDDSNSTGKYNFKVTPKKIYNDTVKSAKVQSMTYTGKNLTPKLTVTGSNGKTLKNGTDYTVTYSPKTVKNVGTYKATIKGKGNYSGSQTVTFTVNPPATTIKSVSPINGGFKVNINKQTGGTKGYQIEWNTNSKFPSSSVRTDMVTKNTTLSKTITDLAANKTFYVRVRTYNTVGGTTYYSAWSKTQKVTTK